MRWLAGAASAEIAIRPGTPMAGYMARTGPSEGTHDPLTASAFVIKSDGHLFALIAVDLLGVDRELVDEIARDAGIDAGAIALAASHTHSGPAGVIARIHPAEHGAVDPLLRRKVVATCAQLVRSAMTRMEPAEVSFGTADAAGIAANRNDPHGPFDPTVRVIQATGLTGTPIATVVSFACHPTILPAESRLISAEFPGAMRRALRLPGQVLYVNGAAGDVSTRYTRQSQDVAEVERVGRALAEAARTAIATARPIEGELGRGVVQINLPVRSSSDVEAAGEMALLAESRLATGDLTAAEVRIEQTRLQGTIMLERLAETGMAHVAPSVEIPWWRLGDLRLIGIPGELFASLGAEVIEALPDSLLLGYTNGYVGYLPDRAAYAAGLYEALASPYAEGVGEVLVTALVDRL